MTARRPAHIDPTDPGAVPAFLAHVGQMGMSLKESLAQLGDYEQCTYCHAYFAVPASKMCPCCHWFGNPDLLVVFHCELMTVAEARQARGLTDEEMR